MKQNTGVFPTPNLGKANRYLSKHEFIKNEAQTLLKLNSGKLKKKKLPILFFSLSYIQAHKTVSDH